jgi:UDP-hydrolysing UDP-N-acetyl-D-glucosamine 2-epimerase
MYNLELSKPILLVIQHPVTGESNEAGTQIRETMEAVREMGYQTIVIYPNADAGGRKMIKVIEEYRKYPFIQIYKNLPHKVYLSLMKIANVMIGNSSSGIIEAPSLHLPAVNIGTRQKGRERADNLIEVDYSRDQIKKAIRKAIHDKVFRGSLKKYKNPYGDGKTGLRIANILSKIKIDDKLLQKRITY